jgi:hypothetical protein
MEGKLAAAVADQRNLKTKAYNADIATKVVNGRQENVRKLAQAHDVSTKMVNATLPKDLQLSNKLAKWNQFGLLGDEEGVSQNEQSVCNDKPRHFMTILDDVLTIGESTEGEECAGRTHPHSVARGDVRNRTAADFAESTAKSP